MVSNWMLGKNKKLLSLKIKSTYMFLICHIHLSVRLSVFIQSVQNITYPMLLLFKILFQTFSVQRYFHSLLLCKSSSQWCFSNFLCENVSKNGKYVRPRKGNDRLGPAITLLLRISKNSLLLKKILIIIKSIRWGSKFCHRYKDCDYLFVLISTVLLLLIEY